VGEPLIQIPEGANLQVSDSQRNPVSLPVFRADDARRKDHNTPPTQKPDTEERPRRRSLYPDTLGEGNCQWKLRSKENIDRHKDKKGIESRRRSRARGQASRRG